MVNSYRTYLIRANLFPVLLVSYLLLALLGPHQGRAEFYPFFTWNLFSRSSQMRADSVILIKEIDGERLEKPTLFFDMGERFQAARSKDIRLGKLLDNLVRAKRVNNFELSARLLDVIKSTFMADAKYVKFDVAIITYNPINRYQSGEIVDVKLVQSDEKVQ